MDKLIGVLGGMGPGASQLFYQMVTERTEANCDQDHVRMLIYSDSGMPDRTAAILKGDTEAVCQRLYQDARMLETCGCQCLAITCNTAHYFAEKVEEQLNIPVIHMIEETTRVIARENPAGKVAVLATDGTIQTGLYQGRLEQKGLTPYVPEKAIQAEVMHQIYDRIKKGLPWDEPSWRTIEEAIKAAGCSQAIMACTELSVIKADNRLSDYYIDPMAVLAEQVILFSGKKLKQKRTGEMQHGFAERQ